MNKQQKGPRRHHWRPQWYLRGFSIPDNPEHCHALNVVSGKAICNTHIKNLAVEKDFYRFADDFSGIEPQISQFDGIMSRIFSEIVSENQMTFRNQDEYEYKTEMMLRFIAHIMAFDPAVRDGIINAAKMIAPEDITDKDDVESIPMHIVSYIRYLGIIRNMGKIRFKAFTANDDNFFICPDVINFITTYDNELHLYFPIHKNLCLYSCTSKEILDTHNPSVAEINTILLSESRHFVYFPSWDLKIHNGIEEIPIKNLINKGIMEMIEIWYKKTSIINPVSCCPINLALSFHITEKHTPDDAEKEALAYIEKTISNIKSDIYAMCIVHDENYDGRSPLSLDKFVEITREVSKLADLNIKHFCSEGMATIFFRMHESNDGSSMTLRVGKREDIKTLEDALNARVICQIMPFNQWVDAVVASNIYDNEGIRIATEMAESVKCPIDAQQAHTFLSEFVSHTQMELNNIRDLARQGEATPDMLFLPEPKEGNMVENCSMSDIANKVNSLIKRSLEMDTITDSISLNEIFQSGEILIPHSDNNLSLFSSWDKKIENLCISKTEGSGATFSIWLHIFNLCLSTPQFLVFVAMKEYSTLLRTIIDDLQQVILGYKLSNSMPVISLIGKPSRPTGIRFPNGSEIKFLGLRGKNGLSSKKTAQKIEKEPPQLFWLSDASELYDFDIWNPIHRILLSQNKQCQIILETYPKSPHHWIYKLFHSDEPGILDLHEGKDIAIKDTVDKCGSMMWLDFKLHDNPVMFQFHDERERKDIAIKLLKHIQINGSNNVESHIYAMCIMHDENFDRRSPLSLDKFTEIAMYVSKLANINIKHFLLESIATVFFRMHESNDGSSMTLRVAKRDDINTAEDALNATVVCNIMPFNQWVESVTNTFYDNEGIHIATEGANALECPTHARDAHFFLAEFVSHTQMELNGIRELSRRGEAITSIDMQYSRGEATTTNMQYALLFLPEKDGEPVEACSMSDIAENVDSIVRLQWD